MRSKNEMICLSPVVIVTAWSWLCAKSVELKDGAALAVSMTWNWWDNENNKPYMLGQQVYIIEDDSVTTMGQWLIDEAKVGVIRDNAEQPAEDPDPGGQMYSGEKTEDAAGCHPGQ